MHQCVENVTRCSLFPLCTFQRADLIILLFDAHKLDISDELKGAIDVLKGHEDKIRCILNKADQIDRQQLMRVYGALLWSLGKTMSSPEVARVYVGSFWDESLRNLDNAALFEAEEKDLMKDLAILPRQSAVRKINEVCHRTSLCPHFEFRIRSPLSFLTLLLSCLYAACQACSQGQDVGIYYWSLEGTNASDDG